MLVAYRLAGKEEVHMYFENNVPIYQQVVKDIKRKMVTGRLQLGMKLPSARDLALEYKINPNTSIRIYKELEMEELCYTKRGLGTYLTEDGVKLKNIRVEMADNLLKSFVAGMKDLGFTKEETVDEIEKYYE